MLWVWPLDLTFGFDWEPQPIWLALYSISPCFNYMISFALLPTAFLLLLQDAHMETAKPALQPSESSGTAIEQLVEWLHVGIWFLLNNFDKMQSQPVWTLLEQHFIPHGLLPNNDWKWNRLQVSEQQKCCSDARSSILSRCVMFTSMKQQLVRRLRT